MRSSCGGVLRLKAHDAAIAGGVAGGTGEVVEGLSGDADQMGGDEGSTFGCTLHAVFEAAFPFEDGPAIVSSGGETREDLLEVDLTVAEGAEAARAFFPAEVAAVDAGLGTGAEFGVLDVEGLNAAGVDVDEADVVEALENEVRGVVVDVDAGVIAGGFEEHFEGGTVVEVFAGVEFVGDIDAVLVCKVEDGEPAGGEFFEAVFDEACGALGPGVEKGPEESAGEGGRDGEAHIGAGLDDVLHLLDGPFAAGFGVAANFRGSEAVEEFVVGGVGGDELALEVACQLGDGEAVCLALNLVAIGFGFSGFLDVQDAGIPAGELDAGIAVAFHVSGDVREVVEGRCVTHELGEEDCRSFDLSRKSLCHIRYPSYALDKAVSRLL